MQNTPPAAPLLPPRHPNQSVRPTPMRTPTFVLAIADVGFFGAMADGISRAAQTKPACPMAVAQ